MVAKKSEANGPMAWKISGSMNKNRLDRSMVGKEIEERYRRKIEKHEADDEPCDERNGIPW